MDGLKKGTHLLYIEGFFTAVFGDFGQLFVVNDEQDMLTTKLTELHALLDEVSLSLALGVVAVDVVLDEGIPVFTSGGLRVLLWHWKSLWMRS